MIKYTELEGYKNLGEVEIFSHVYQFIECKNGNRSPMIMLINAFETNKVFKGYLFMGKNTYSSVPLTEKEKETLEGVIGKVTEVNFMEFTKGTILEGGYDSFKEVKGDELLHGE